MVKRTTRGVLREIRLRIISREPGAAEILMNILAACGISREALVELTQRKRRYILFYPKTSAQARRATRALKTLNCLNGKRGAMLETRTLYKKDWQDRWKKDFKPFTLGNNFFVIPADWPAGTMDWHKKYRAGDRIPIVIDTAMAFGSGLHETTRFMAQLIDSCAGRFESFLDIGTGTGILSVVAAKRGPAKIDAIDFNPDCIKVANANFKRNGCRPSSLAVADIHHYASRKKYDFVAANLVTHNLVKAGRKLVSLVSPGKYLAVSGISLENVPIFKKAFRKYPLRPLKIIKGKEWAAMLYKTRERRQGDA